MLYNVCSAFGDVVSDWTRVPAQPPDSCSITDMWLLQVRGAEIYFRSDNDIFITREPRRVSSLPCCLCVGIYHGL